MNATDWAEEFRRVYDRATAAWRAGRRSPAVMFGPADTAFLATIGCSAQELFDFVDDGLNDGEPAFETVLLITAVRRDYFLRVQGGVPSKNVIRMEDLPPKHEAVEGIRWLPRLIEKARAKLRGEMPPDLMYGCGGDRPFARSMNLHLADFLREVWAAGDDNRRVIEFVKRQRATG